MDEKRLSDAEVAEIATRLEKATPGPWLYNDYYWVVQTHSDAVPLGAVCRVGNTARSHEDAEFIAHSRVDTERLLVDRNALRAALAAREVEVTSAYFEIGRRDDTIKGLREEIERMRVKGGTLPPMAG